MSTKNSDKDKGGKGGPAPKETDKGKTPPPTSNKDVKDVKPKEAVKQSPSIGRIVTFKPTETQKAEMNPTGIIRSTLPAIIVSCDKDAKTVNLKVFADGEKDFWIQNVKEGKEEGTWNWPSRD